MSPRVAELAKKLNEAMLTEEKEKVKSRLGIAANHPEVAPLETEKSSPFDRINAGRDWIARWDCPAF